MPVRRSPKIRPSGANTTPSSSQSLERTKDKLRAMKAYRRRLEQMKAKK